MQTKINRDLNLPKRKRNSGNFHLSSLVHVGKKPQYRWTHNELMDANISLLNRLGFVSDKQGPGGKMFFGKKGRSDIMGAFPKTGRMILIECKVWGKDKLSDEQIQYLNRYAESGAVCIVSHSPDDTADVLRPLGFKDISLFEMVN